MVDMDPWGRQFENIQVPEMRQALSSPQVLPEAFSVGPSIHEQMNEIAKGNLANEFCERLVEYCKEFDKQIDEEHEIGVRLISYGQSITIYVEDIGYWNPSLIHFYGLMLDSKMPVQLIQHVSQISFLLVALPKKDPNKPKKSFGFASESSSTEEKSKAD